MSLRKRAAEGIFWSAVHNWGEQGVTFLLFLVLARLLMPEDFGLVALATVYIAFVTIILEQGFNDAIIQREQLLQDHLDTAFWVNIMLSGLLVAGSFGMSGFIAAFFREPRLAPILGWLSLTLLFGALIGTQQAILRRRFEFRVIAICSLISTCVGGCVGVILAFLGYGVWSLVGLQLVKGVVRAAALWYCSEWRPGVNVSQKSFRELFSFGVNVMGSNILGFFNRRADDFLIGYFLGPVALGYYTVAYRLLRVMTQILTGTTRQVALPAFSRLQQDPERLRRAFYTTTQISALIAFPAFLGMASLAPDLVRGLFGAQWAPSIPVMQILAFIGLLHSVYNFNGTVFLAMGKPFWKLGLALLNSIINVVAFWLVVQWGIVAVSAVYVIRAYLLMPLPIWMIHRLIDIEFRTYLRQLVAPLVGSLVMVSVLFGAKHVLAGSMNVHALLIVCILIGALVYAATIPVFNPALWRQSFDLLRFAIPVRAWKKS